MNSEPTADALDAGNEVFHEAYGGARDGVRHEVPILVVLPSELVLQQQSGRHTVPYSRPSFARAKAAAHISVALFALTDAESHAQHRRAGVERLVEHIGAALDSAPPSPGEPVDDEIKALLQLCLDFARAAREQTPTTALSAKFASDAGPRVLRITELATRVQIAGLHEAVEATLRKLSTDDQALLQVVVVGDHQARVRSLGMQYFKRRFKETPGVDERVTYGENISDAEEAVLLVATRRLDKRIAQAFFGDEDRLQRDVLGDAAKRCIEAMSFPS